MHFAPKVARIINPGVVPKVLAPMNKAQHVVANVSCTHNMLRPVLCVGSFWDSPAPYGPDPETRASGAGRLSSRCSFLSAENLVARIR